VHLSLLFAGRNNACKIKFKHFSEDDAQISALAMVAHIISNAFFLSFNNSFGTSTGPMLPMI
jgi:hypothetical protein